MTLPANEGVIKQLAIICRQSMLQLAMPQCDTRLGQALVW
jgi:hypothetical protein